jgi:acetylornithine deacetylase/succinyl-diaminopimelate desuccinylase-like protein
VKARGDVRVSEPSDPESPAMRIIQGVSESMWPGTPAIPVMSTGATDGSRLRNAGIPVYGVSGIFVDHAEVRIHGKDERAPVKGFFDGAEFLYRLVKALGNE